MTEYGYMGKILIVDLSGKKFEEIILDDSIYRQYVGGYGLGVRILYERMKANVDPLSPENWLGFVVGPLQGTASPSGGRFTVVGKSPLTGGWGDANCGGNFGPALKSTGYDAIFFTGKSPDPVYLWLTDKTKEIRDAGHLWGKDSIETEELIKTELDVKGVRVACIGQAGERLSKIAAVMHDDGRAAGRSGLGAVMGSKNLKAVAVQGSIKVKVANDKQLISLVAELRDELKNDPAPVGALFSELGTPGTYVGSVAVQDAPIKNWKGVRDKDYTLEQATKLSGESFLQFKTRKYACAQCGIGCGAIMARTDDATGQVVKSHRPEYETIGAFGSMCLVDDIDSIMRVNELCNRYGFDTISAGGTVAFAMDCFEAGILTKEDTGGISLNWGNGEAGVQLLELMCKREGIGAILADGVKVAAEKLGKGSEKYAIHVGGQEVPMHDPRNAPGYGYTYEWDPTPARHTQGGLAYPQIGLSDLSLDELNIADAPEQKYNYNLDANGKIQALYSHWYHFMSATGLCLFALLGYKRYPLVETVRAITGWVDFDVTEAIAVGERINTLRHCFNLNQGVSFGTSEELNRNAFRMPKRLLGIPPVESGPISGVTIDIEKVKLSYLKALDWDPTTGRPSNAKLSALGISSLVGDWPS